MADQITPLTQGEIDQFDNQSPASQNVRLGQLLADMITKINLLLTDNTEGE